jgi:hypothetical protein
MSNSRCPSHVPLLGAVVALTAILASHGYARTPSAGALVGVTLDPSDALLQSAAITLVNQNTGEKDSTTSDNLGRVGFVLLGPDMMAISAKFRVTSNDFHGAAVEFFRNDDLNANDFFRNQTNQPRPVLKQNQCGFALGGPIVKDKLFFFG